MHISGKAKPVITIPSCLVRRELAGVTRRHAAQGRQGGLDPVQYVRLQTSETFFDPTPSRQALGHGQGGLDAAFRATAAACPVSDKVTFR